MKLYNLIFKRVFDVFVSTVSLLILSPVLLVTALLILIFLGRPIFFTQQRPGKSSKIFEIVKFRSLSNCIDAEGNLLPDHERLGKFGMHLRASSIDELPALINVLKGEMSLIGPRPLLPEYLPLYSAAQARRHLVRPGLTGLAQVNGRNSLTWEKKFEYDVYYVDNLSFWLDVKIFFITLIRVFKREGINSGTTVGTEPFRGN